MAMGFGLVPGLAATSRWMAGAVLVGSASIAAAQKTPDLRIDTGSPPGATGSFFPKVAASGAAVYSIWEDERNFGPFGPTDVLFSRSLDGGASWLPTPVRLDTGSAPGAAFSFDSRITTSGSAIYVVFASVRVGFGADIYLNRSLDGGMTWLPADVRVDHGPGDTVSTVPEVVAIGSAVYVLWLDDRNSIPLFGPTDVYFNRSLDGGVTWLPADIRLDTGKPPGAASSLSARIAAAGNCVCATWKDSRNSSAFGVADIFFNRSLDGGATWLPGSVRLDVGSAPGSSSSVFPELAVSGSSIYVAWSDPRNGFMDIYFNRSLDAGTTWLAADVRLDVDSAAGAANSRRPRLAAAGSSVYVAWDDVRNGQINRDIYFNRSTDGGTTWLMVDERLDLGDAPGAADSCETRIAATGSSVYVTWVDERTPFATDIYLNRSLDGGATWLASDVRLDVGSPPGAHHSLNPEIVASGSSVYVTWEDRRDGAEDIYFNLALGYQAYGTGTPGAGGSVPRIGGAGRASISGRATIEVAGGVGGAPCVLAYTFAGPASIPTGFGTILLQPPWQRRALVLGGAAGAPGAGSVTSQASIPDDVALLGLRVNFQAAVFDPSGRNGVALSNGLELWIL